MEALQSHRLPINYISKKCLFVLARLRQQGYIKPLPSAHSHVTSCIQMAMMHVLKPAMEPFSSMPAQAGFLTAIWTPWLDSHLKI